MKNYEEVLSKITDFLKEETKTETIVGKQFTLGEYTCAPVIRIGIGLGYGGGEGANTKDGRGELSALGSGVSVEPIGFLVSRKDQINFIPSQSAGASKGLGLAFEKLPELLAKYFDTSKTKKEEPVTS